MIARVEAGRRRCAMACGATSTLRPALVDALPRSRPLPSSENAMETLASANVRNYMRTNDFMSYACSVVCVLCHMRARCRRVQNSLLADSRDSLDPTHNRDHDCAHERAATLFDSHPGMWLHLRHGPRAWHTQRVHRSPETTDA